MFLLYFAPTPGASGIGEVLSAAVMSSYVPRELTPIYILIWRLILTYFTLGFGFFVFSSWVRQGLEGDRTRRRWRSRPGSAMSETHDDSDGAGRGYDASLLRRLLGYLRPYRVAGRSARCCCSCPSRCCARRPAAHRARARRRRAARTTSACSACSPGLYLATLLARFRGGVRRHAAHHVHRPAGDVRPADARSSGTCSGSASATSTAIPSDG